ncbi:alpha/beta hydrolase [Lutimonas saemankumensis]|uniref:alpha/beta hydrolase n=1 Tax=Lutimonas saemankumensis TaxID=483016 RepID=UPI001CD51E51|nr:alpha/beta hydrolase [Lutimonas saemankumensis]MCA0933464.1 alpha/beta hydrolase [Lutimonas saemankumensis]
MLSKGFEFQIANHTLKGQSYEADDAKGVIVIVHGMGEYGKRYERTVVPWLIKESYTVFSYDQFGHGTSEGKKGDNPGFSYLLEALDKVLEKAQKTYPSLPVFLYGHSMGGNVVINYTLRKRHNLKGSIATSPFLQLAFDPPKWKLSFGKIMDRIFPSLTMPNDLELDALSKDPKEIEAYEKDPLVHDKVSTRYSLRLMETGSWAIENATGLTVPMLIVHGTSDRITSCKASQTFAYNSNGKAVFYPIKGGYHELHHDKEKNQLFERIREWLKEQTQT